MLIMCHNVDRVGVLMLIGCLNVYQVSYVDQVSSANKDQHWFPFENAQFIPMF